MIKFFRNIRQKLLSENKFSKYILYALGEIVLVVIGILIALQINAINDRQQDADYEIQILKEIRSSLSKDLERTKSNLLPGLIRKEEAIALTLKTIAYNEVDHDTVILRRDFSHIGISLNFTHDRGPYESLKANGLEKISNDSLRSALVGAYEVNLPSRKTQSEQYNAENKLIREPLRDDLSVFNLVIKEKDSVFVGKSVQFEVLKNNQNFLKYIDLDERVSRAYRQWIEEDVALYEHLIKSITSELAQ